MNITTMIVTHPTRLEQATNLAHTVNGIRVIDDHNHGCATNHDRALAQAITAHGHTDGWIVILEDDAIPCHDWHNQLHAALKACPTRIASLYLGTNYPTRGQAAIQQAVNTDANWIIHPYLRHAVGYAIKADLAPRILQSVTHRYGEADKRLCATARELWEPIAYSNPSLVDHADHTPVITHLPTGQQRRRTKPRVAHQHGTRDHWTSDSITIN